MIPWTPSSRAGFLSTKTVRSIQRTKKRRKTLEQKNKKKAGYAIGNRLAELKQSVVGCLVMVVVAMVTFSKPARLSIRKPTAGCFMRSSTILHCSDSIGAEKKLPPHQTPSSKSPRHTFINVLRFGQGHAFTGSKAQALGVCARTATWRSGCRRA